MSDRLVSGETEHCIYRPAKPKLLWKDVSSQVTMQNQMSLSLRISCLFSFGVFLAVLLNFLQKQKGITIFSPGLFGDVLNSAWWIPPTFGVGSAAVGLLLPFLDRRIGHQTKPFMEWSHVMRCIALFIGLNHAIAKISFESNSHISFALGLCSVGLWYFFDQSLLGLALGAITATIATCVTQLLVALDVFGYSDPDFLYMTSWVPWLYFSGGITVGMVGRALATIDTKSMYLPSKDHQD